MKDGYFYDKDGNEVIQKMQTEDGIPKGMKRICSERGYDVTRYNKEQLIDLLERELDFIDDARHNILIDAVKKRNKYAICKYELNRIHGKCLFIS